MKFLCDVHISYKLVSFLNSLGFETIHVNNILDRWNSKDSDICIFADSNNLILISKDSDFRDSYFIKQTPKKLIKINLGNISNLELTDIFKNSIDQFQKLDSKPNFLIEINKDMITYIS